MANHFYMARYSDTNNGHKTVKIISSTKMGHINATSWITKAKTAVPHAHPNLVFTSAGIANPGETPDFVYDGREPVKLK